MQVVTEPRSGSSPASFNRSAPFISFTISHLLISQWNKVNACWERLGCCSADRWAAQCAVSPPCPSVFTCTSTSASIFLFPSWALVALAEWHLHKSKGCMCRLSWRERQKVLQQGKENMGTDLEVELKTWTDPRVHCKVVFLLFKSFGCCFGFSFQLGECNKLLAQPVFCPHKYSDINIWRSFLL